MEGQPPLARHVEVENGGIQDEFAARERPARALHAHATAVEQLIAQDAAANRNAGIDLGYFGHLPGRRAQVQQVDEVEVASWSPCTGPNAAARSTSVAVKWPVLVPHRLRPVEPARPGDEAGHVGDQPGGERGEIVGLEAVGMEADARDLDQRRAFPRSDHGRCAPCPPSVGAGG